MLQENSDISESHIKDFHLGDSGATDIYDVLCDNTKLCTLSIQDCGVGNKYTVRFVPSLRQNFSLRSLRLRQIGINRKGGMDIAATLRSYNYNIGAVIFDSTSIEDIYDSI